MKDQSLNSLLWLWIPLAIFAGQIVIELFVPNALKGTLHSEGGPHEVLQFTFAALGLIWAIKCLIKVWPDAHPLLIAWVIFFCFGCAYIAGEEISWGQHIFYWDTPEYWAVMNDQQETNLHNISSWLDQKPKLLLLAGVVVGGLIIPFLQKHKPEILSQKIQIIYPPIILGPTAALTLATKLIDKVDEHLTETILLSRASEVEELYLFYFVMLYLVVLHRRLLQQ